MGAVTLQLGGSAELWIAPDYQWIDNHLNSYALRVAYAVCC